MILIVSRIKQYLTPFLFGLIAILFCCLFFYSPDQLDYIEDNQLLPMIVPSITISGTIKMYLISVFIFFCFIYNVIRKKKIRIDIFVFFLVIRILFALIMIPVVVTTGGEIRFGNYFLYLLELLLYLACLSSIDKDNELALLKVLKIFVFIVALETIYQSIFGIMNQVPYISTWYKANLNTPVGSSNSLSAIILPVLIASSFQKEKSYKDIVLIAICIVAVVLSKSRWAMGIMLLSFLLLYVKKLTLERLIVGLLLSGVILWFMSDFRSEISLVFSGFSDNVSGSTANKLSSGRLAGYQEYLDVFYDYPFLGYGPNYIESRAHNIVIDILYQSGVIGFFIFIYSFIYILNRYNRKKTFSDSTGHFYYIIVVVAFIQSLGEISFFTDIVCDVIFLSSLSIISQKGKRKMQNGYLELKQVDNSVIFNK